MEKRKTIVAGFDIGGAHLKVTRAESGRIVDAVTIATPLWQGLDTLTAGLREAEPVYSGADVRAFTMTGELADVFPSREAGVAGLLERISAQFPGGEKLIYAGRSGFVGMNEAAGLANDIASANWHATAALVARLVGEALFVDMGSTTTDLIPVRGGAVANRGYSDAERLLSGELVYTGFTRTFLFGVASSAPVRGQITPLMNEYFASMADAHRMLGVLDESDDKHASADGQAKTVTGSMARLARMVGRDAADLEPAEWQTIARWFSEKQLRLVHDAAFRAAGGLADDAPIVGAGTGRWQLRRLAERMERRFVDFADLIPADDAARGEASSAAPATAVALLAGNAR
ncbi:probable H4MPT-linked C1 transfer pathway protein [Mesorhizobium albiziae]|uniref:Probable H4MPT-linked C1 transfer pathway protein n=1 Tax=Neomesorhizobium albiziae TaxID=335020 RepID=A0A1I3VN83_9HYPH|nr:hydantoinase/oxoprolinase family protein [Mesorhizobium albiziae]GLS28992.1 ATP synthase subunit C [Mesorhizobium albiziae]SFJ95707.1 probable H4MPT-linked C1 transfer pathway protein [Mesorhizobium albiziae]